MSYVKAEGTRGKRMIEVTIESIRVSLVNYQRVVILKERNTGRDRYLPIWIGPAEADAIALQLQEVTVARPLTHDLLRSVINTLGAKVESVVVNDLANDTFFARIVLDTNGQQTEIDSRPSDALALAVRAKVPIYVAETVLEKAGIYLDEEGSAGKPRPQDQKAPPVSEDELRKMSAFRDFIDTLDMEGLGGAGGAGGGKPEDQ